MWLRLVQQHPLWLIELLPAKLSWFWLSTDILFYSHAYGSAVQFGRDAMVFVWWGYLLLAVAALARMHRAGENDALWLFLGWLGLVAIAHLPFGMNTRLRIPLADFPIALLAGRRLAETQLARGGEREPAA
jgi:hypothetical protein